MKLLTISAIIGLGNPGPNFAFTPHNIGFLILDQLNDTYGNGLWHKKKDMLTSNITINDKKILLVKPQTFMNESGRVLADLRKQGVKQSNILAVYDNINKPFGVISINHASQGLGGHNGIRSLVEHGGKDFAQLRIGVGRPENKSEVGTFVTSPFEQSDEEVSKLIRSAIKKLEESLPK